MNRIYKILLIFYLVFVFLVIYSTLSPEIMALKTEIRTGFADYCIPGSTIPMTIIIENSEKTINGNLSIYLQGQKGNPISTKYTFNIILPQDSRKIYRGVIPLNQGNLISVITNRNTNVRSIQTKLVVELSNEDELINKEIIDLNDFLFDVSAILVVKDSGTGFTFLNSEGDSNKIIYEKPQYLPVNWLAYTGIQTIIFDNTELNHLNENQIIAIKKWVSLGGTVLINGDGLTRMINSQLLEELFPGQSGRKKTVTLNPSFLTGDYKEHLPQSKNLEVQEIKNAAGNVVLSVENSPLLFNRSYNRGQIAVLTFDLKQYNLNEWPEKLIFIQNLLPQNNNIYQKTYITATETGLLNGLSGAMLQSLNFKVATRWLVLLLFALFTGIIYGIYTLSFAKYNILKKVILISGVTIIMMIIIFILFGKPAIRDNNILGEIAIINKYDESDLALIEGYHIIFSGHGNPLKMVLDINNGVMSGFNNEDTGLIENQSLINIDNENYSLIFDRNKTWSAGLFHSKYVAEVPLTITGDRKQNQITLSVKNNSGMKISQLFLKHGQGWYQLSTGLRAGSRNSYQFDTEHEGKQDPPWTGKNQELQIYDRDQNLERQVLDRLYKRKIKMQPEYWENRSYAILILEGESLDGSVKLEIPGQRECKGFLILPVALD